MGKGVRGFRVELLALMVVVVASSCCLIVSILSVVDQVVVGVAQRLTPAMLIGAGLVIGASVFIAWRVRVRFLSSAYWRATTCPRCGSPIHRVHRSRAGEGGEQGLSAARVAVSLREGQMWMVRVAA